VGKKKAGSIVIRLEKGDHHNLDSMKKCVGIGYRRGKAQRAKRKMEKKQ